MWVRTLQQVNHVAVDGLLITDRKAMVVVKACGCKRHWCDKDANPMAASTASVSMARGNGRKATGPLKIPSGVNRTSEVAHYVVCAQQVDAVHMHRIRPPLQEGRCALLLLQKVCTGAETPMGLGFLTTFLNLLCFQAGTSGIASL